MLVGTDVRLRREPDGAVVSTHPAALYETFEPLTRVYETVTLFAREAPSDLPAVGVADGPGLSATLVPNFSSMGDLRSTLVPTLVRAMREVGRHDVVLGRVPEPLSIILGWAAVVRGRPFIANVVADPANPRLGDGPVRSQLDRAVLAGVRALVRRSTATIYVTETYLQRRCPPPQGRPTLVRSNVRIDQTWFQPPRVTGPASAARVVLVGGNQNWDKGQRVLLDAVAQLKSEGVLLDVTFVGGGRLLEAIVAEAERRGIADRVNVVGQVETRTHLAQILDGHDIFCLPSFSEGLPRAMVEAMARGVPAVGSDAGGIPELLPPDAVAPAGDSRALAAALRRVIEDPAPLARSRHAVETAERIAVASKTETLVEFLRGLTMRN